MTCEEGHPETSLSDWQAFGRECSPCLIEQVIERKDCNIPKVFVPLARGMAVASPALLHCIGYLPGMGRPRDWLELSPGYFERHLYGNNHLMVRECEGKNLWTVERLRGGRRHRDADEILVHDFGSTPIVTRSHEAAMWLAEHSHEDGPPRSMRWIKAIPDNLEGALATLRRREQLEVLH